MRGRSEWDSVYGTPFAPQVQTDEQKCYDNEFSDCHGTNTSSISLLPFIAAPLTRRLDCHNTQVLWSPPTIPSYRRRGNHLQQVAVGYALRIRIKLKDGLSNIISERELFQK